MDQSYKYCLYMQNMRNGLKINLFCRLQRLIASKNQLQSVPLALFKNRSVQVVDLSGNKLKHLPPHGSLDSFMFNEIWECDKLQSLKLVENMLIQIPKGIHGATSLERLNVSRNKLTFFVTPWNCPLVCNL